MNKILVSRNYLLNRLDESYRKIKNCNHPESNYIRFSAKGGEVTMYNVFVPIEVRFDCSYSNEFNVTVYIESINRLMDFLKTIDEQPVTLELKDSKIFNVKICEAYL